MLKLLLGLLLHLLMLLHELLLAFACMFDQPVRELPGLFLSRPADDLQAHAEADLVLAAVMGRLHRLAA